MDDANAPSSSFFPDDKRDMSLPDDKRDMSLPDDKRDMSLPDDKRDVFLLDGERVLSLPDDEQDVSLPDDEQDVSLPDDEQDVSHPDDERRVSFPDDERDVSLPNNKRDASLPNNKRDALKILGSNKIETNPISSLSQNFVGFFKDDLKRIAEKLDDVQKNQNVLIESLNQEKDKMAVNADVEEIEAAMTQINHYRLKLGHIKKTMLALKENSYRYSAFLQ